LIFREVFVDSWMVVRGMLTRCSIEYYD